MAYFIKRKVLLLEEVMEDWVPLPLKLSSPFRGISSSNIYIYIELITDEFHHRISSYIEMEQQEKKRSLPLCTLLHHINKKRLPKQHIRLVFLYFLFFINVFRYKICSRNKSLIPSIACFWEPAQDHSFSYSPFIYVFLHPLFMLS